MLEKKEDGQPQDERIRLALSRDEAGNVEIYAMATDTCLVLPRMDVELLIASLSNLDREVYPHETVCLDPIF